MAQVQYVQQEGGKGLKLLVFYYFLPLPLMLCEIFSDALHSLPKLKIKYVCHKGIECFNYLQKHSDLWVKKP